MANTASSKAMAKPFSVIVVSGPQLGINVLVFSKPFTAACAPAHISAETQNLSVMTDIMSDVTQTNPPRPLEMIVASAR